MAKQQQATPDDVGRVRLVLTGARLIGNVAREPKFCLLEGVCPAGVTAADIDKAIVAGDVLVQRA